jgi:hypothetical protein
MNELKVSECKNKSNIDFFEKKFGKNSNKKTNLNDFTELGIIFIIIIYYLLLSWKY